MTHTANISHPEVASFFDSATHTVTHIVSDPSTRRAAIIDSVMGYEPHGAGISFAGADTLVEYVRTHKLTVEWILETHIHADHLSAAPYLQEKLGGKIGIGEHIINVQETFGKVFNAGTEFARDGSAFDRLWKDGDTFKLGVIDARVIHTPGHTPADVSYLIGDALFVGDTIFMPDYGSARCDFPGGSAETMFESVQKLYALPGETRMFMCHDYLPAGRSEFAWETTVEEQKRANVLLRAGTDKQHFAQMRDEKDRALGVPALIIPSLQVNMRAGNLPEPESNGVRYLKVPIDSVFAKKNNT